jgi:hypothetical protein
MVEIRVPGFVSLQPAGEEPNKQEQKHPSLDPLLRLFLAICLSLNQRDDYARKNGNGDEPTNDGEIVHEFSKFHILLILMFQERQTPHAISKRRDDTLTS